MLNSMLPGHTVVSCAASDVARNLNGVDVVIPSVAKISAEIIEKGTFGLIQQLGIGLDPVDIPAATKSGVWVAPVPGAGSGNAESVAELAIMFILGLMRRYEEAHANVMKGVFFKPTGKSLLGKTVCIFGTGDIGSAIAQRLAPFGVKLKGVRRSAAKAPGFDQVFSFNDLAAALADSDVIVLALPETAETKKMINRETLAMMKPGAYLVNIARGGIIDTDALVDALQSGHLAGAGTDVFTEEPFDPTHPLLQLNVMATPHIGGNTDVSVHGITAVVAENVKRYAAGEVPLHVVNTLTEPRRSKLPAH
jgi:phosphoglycerate dehydrogenase-like enzyme